MTVEDVIERHRAAGRTFDAGGTTSFVRECGDGEPVVCLHGVPASCFLYRKVLPELAQRGLRGIAFDYPGLGLAARPRMFDYSFTGLGQFCTAAVDALGLQRFHLVVHDIGGPVGFELARAMPERIRTLTVLNTVVDVAAFRRPWEMKPFVPRWLGPLYLASVTPRVFRVLWYRAALYDRSVMTDDEVDAYLALVKREDGGRAFLRIMRGFELTPHKQGQYRQALADVPYPVQIVWGEHDRALKIDEHGRRVADVAGVPIQRVQARHFLQEERPGEVAEAIATLASTAR